MYFPTTALPLFQHLLYSLMALLTLCIAPLNSAHAGNFADDPEVIVFIEEMWTRHGLDKAELQEQFSRIETDERVLKYIAPPSQPGQRSWQRYRSRFLDEVRITSGLRFWQENAGTLAKAKALYGVPEEIIVAIIGVETLYGRNTGSFGTFEALATLAFHYPRRAEFFRQELEQLLLLARENQMDPLNITGSYAGALGIPQFMPGSLRRYGVDFDGDGRIDLENSVPDAIGSVAHFLQQHGWQAEGPIAVPARLNRAPAPQWIDAGIRPTLLAADLLAAGVLADIEPSQKVTLVDLVTPSQSTEYWLGMENFYVITRYNRSSFYAMSVYQLAQSISNRYGRAVKAGL